MSWEGLQWTLNLKDFGYLTRMLMFDDMEGAFHWDDISYNSYEWTVGIRDDDSFVANKCLYLVPADLSDRFVSAARHTQMQAANRVALGLAFKFFGDVKLQFQLMIYVDGVLATPGLTYDVGSGLWSYLNSSGGETSIGTQTLEANSWHIMLFIADLSEQVYVRAYSDEKTLDILNSPIPVTTTTEGNGLRTVVRVDQVGETHGWLRVDNVLVLRD